jgi:serpin B
MTQGEWKSKFENAETKKNNFYVRRDKIRVADFMNQKGKFNYYTSEELRAHVLEMPYIGDDVSMMIVLPPFEDDSLLVRGYAAKLAQNGTVHNSMLC